MDGRILSNERLKGDYWRVVFDAPGIAPKAQAGQFVHVRILSLRDRILRRPFSICDAEANGRLTVVYKIVGAGTEELSGLDAGDFCDLMGPLGHPFTMPEPGTVPLILAGGYGSAATLLLAKRAKIKGMLLLGARSEADLILVEEYQALGFEVRIATDDGSVGRKGFVTELLEDAVKDAGASKAMIYGCGPTGMLMALGKKSLEIGVKAELSLDHHMCCGVGACFACVVKIKDASNPDGWRYARTCKEGPVFKAEEVWYNG